MKGPRQALPLLLKAEDSVSQGFGREGSPWTILLWGSRETPRRENKRKGTAWTPPWIFSSLMGSLQTAEISGMLPGQGCTDFSSCWTERQKCQFHPFPHPNQLLMAFAAGNWAQVSLQTLQALKILTRVPDPPQTKGSAWKNNRLPSREDLEELLKRKWNPNIISCSCCRNKSCSHRVPALNQLGREPEGQEGVRWNSGQAGRKHQEETPAAAVEAKNGQRL